MVRRAPCDDSRLRAASSVRESALARLRGEVARDAYDRLLPNSRWNEHPRLRVAPEGEDRSRGGRRFTPPCALRLRAVRAACGRFLPDAAACALPLTPESPCARRRECSSRDDVHAAEIGSPPHPVKGCGAPRSRAPRLAAEKARGEGLRANEPCNDTRTVDAPADLLGPRGGCLGSGIAPLRAALARVRDAGPPSRRAAGEGERTSAPRGAEARLEVRAVATRGGRARDESRDGRAKRRSRAAESRGSQRAARLRVRPIPGSPAPGHLLSPPARGRRSHRSPPPSGRGGFDDRLRDAIEGAWGPRLFAFAGRSLLAKVDRLGDPRREARDPGGESRCLSFVRSDARRGIAPEVTPTGLRSELASRALRTASSNLGESRRSCALHAPIKRCIVGSGAGVAAAGRQGGWLPDRCDDPNARTTSTYREVTRAGVPRTS